MPGLEPENPMSSAFKLDSEKKLSLPERELLHEVLLALRVIRYGSVILTVHDGHVVEIQKIERIRKGTAK
jgi:hypothetical protein